MKRTIRRIAPWLAAAAVGGTLFLAPVASAATTTQTGPDQSTQTGPDSGADPSVPYGTHSNSNLPYDDAGNQYQQAGAV